MAYGTIEYDDSGKPICEICGKSFNRVISHVRQKHEMSEREYKITFGFELKKGICSKESSEKSRDAVFENYENVIVENLLVRGAESRFKNGSKGRTKDMVSEQTRIKLRARLESPKMKRILKKTGFKLGKSGLGNQIRWSK